MFNLKVYAAGIKFEFAREMEEQIYLRYGQSVRLENPV